MTETQALLYNAILEHPDFPQDTALKGEWNGYLSAECDLHCYLQIKVGVGHHNWESRYHRYVREFQKQYGRCNFQEVAAYTWYWNTEKNDAAKDLAESWRKSPGHWKSIINPNVFQFAFDMKQDPESKTWYGTGLLSEKL